MVRVSVSLPSTASVRTRIIERAEGKLLSRGDGGLLRDRVLVFAQEFTDPMRGMAAALAFYPEARQVFDEVLADEEQQGDEIGDRNLFEEVVVGGGLTAAIYAASAGTSPLVVERGLRLGGVFGITNTPVFALNSRNRPGELGGPGKGASLNNIPGGALQLADFTGAEYPSQDLFGLAIRFNLLWYAKVITETKVVKAKLVDDEYIELTLSGARTVYADKVVVATGIGDPVLGPAELADSETVYSFNRFLRRVGKSGARPLDGLRKVAVIGSGDSGCATVGMLLGQEPLADRMSLSLDYVERIDWFGQQCISAEEFKEARSRYAGIARYMPRSKGDRYYRVAPRPGRTLNVERSSVLHRNLSGELARYGPYDAIIVCTGFRESQDDIFAPLVSPFVPLFEDVTSEDGEVVARRYTGTNVYRVGPCAKIPVGEEEDALTDVIPPNSAANFRYARKTAKFAQLQ